MGGDFSYNNASNDFVWNASDSLVVLGSAFITANSFINTGDITADTLNLSVAGDFDYGSEFLGNGNIDVTIFNLQVGGDFSYDDASNNFVWNASDSLVVLGNAFITANSFINTGDITADTLNISVAGDFDYISDYLNNGNIDANNQYFTIRNSDFTNNQNYRKIKCICGNISSIDKTIGGNKSTS